MIDDDDLAGALDAESLSEGMTDKVHLFCNVAMNPAPAVQVLVGSLEAVLSPRNML